jgi:hypothetical protein
MKRNWYAAYCPYGTNVAYESGCYTVHVFTSKADRDSWVDADLCDNGTPSREKITRKVARYIAGARLFMPSRPLFDTWDGILYDNGAIYH